MSSGFKINGVDIKAPTTFKIARYPITKGNRTADGNMHLDLVAWKRKFFFTWDCWSMSDYDKFMGLLVGKKGIFVTLTYPDNGKIYTAKVYPGELPTDVYQVRKGTWIWKDVSFNLIEK